MSPRHAPLPEIPEPVESEVTRRALPSGRSLVLRTGGAGEEIEIRGAGGEVELRITLTDAGPVVSIRGARVEIEAPDVAFRCRSVGVDAEGPVRIASAEDVCIEADEVRAVTRKDI